MVTNLKVSIRDLSVKVNEQLPQLQGEISPKEDSFGCSSGLAALQVYDTPHIRVLVGERVRKRLDAKSIEKSKMENRTVCLADDFAIHLPSSMPSSSLLKHKAFTIELYPILLGGSFNERKAK